MPGAGSILDTIFGCCLGRRCRTSTSIRSEAGPSERGQGGDDERTPLIGREARGSSASKTLRDDRHTGATTEQGATQSTSEGNSEGSILPKRKQINLDRLKEIRDGANSAFFHVDNGQLLPSSSSSRPLNLNASQVGSTSRKEQRRERASHQDLVNESDKAERLYRAALTTPLESSPAVTEGEESELADDAEATLALVRQLRVSVREAPKSNKEEQTGKASSPALYDRKTSSSPEEAHARMGYGSAEAKDEIPTDAPGGRTHPTINKLPSLHSLRTLRLSTPQSLGSPSWGSEKSPSLDEEEWGRRGRTRSKRGLAWIDCGPSRGLPPPDRPKLDEIFDQAEEHHAQSIIPVVTSATAATVDEEIPNALRLSSAKPSKMTRAVQDMLKATSPVAETWEGGQEPQ